MEIARIWLIDISSGVVWFGACETEPRIMAETTVPHWTIGAALALFGTAVAAEPMGEATRHTE